MTTPAAAFLTRVADRLERGWTQGAYARGADENSIDFTDARAVCWCLEGAFYAEDQETHPVRMAALDALYTATNAENLPLFNDTPGRTQAEVVRVVRMAASKMEEG